MSPRIKILTQENKMNSRTTPPISSDKEKTPHLTITLSARVVGLTIAGLFTLFVAWMAPTVFASGAPVSLDPNFSVAANGLVVVPSVAQATPPTLINYQGELANNNGQPLGNQTVTLNFKIYQQETGGNFDWNETHSNVPTDADGRFNVILNSTGVAQGNLANLMTGSTNLWLEVTVQGSTLIPRQRITSTGFALHANTAARAATADAVSSVPWSSLASVPSGFGDGTDDVGRVGTGLTLNGDLFEVDAKYRLPQSCNDDQIPEWDATNNVWWCADNGIVYTAGDGLNLTGTQFSASYGGNGSSTLVSRMDHTHAGQSWSANFHTGLHITNTLSTSGATAFSGLTTGSSGNTFGVRGESTSSSQASSGVYGVASANSGEVYGVFGKTNSSSGYGVYSDGNAYVDGSMKIDGDLTTTNSVALGGHTTIDGNLSVSGTLSLNGVALNGTNYLSIPAADFIPHKAYAGYENTGSGVYASSSGCAGSSPTVIKIFAPVSLPHQAIIKSVTVYMHDREGSPDTANNSYCTTWATTKLMRTDYMTTTTQLTSFQVPPFGTTYSPFEFLNTTSPALSVTIDNSQYGYFLAVELLGKINTAPELRGVIVKYEYAKP
jgi:hypothetical protein